MLDQPSGSVAETGPVSLYERASARGLEIAGGVRPDQLALPTPCSAWTVHDLIDHLVGGTVYLLGAISGLPVEPPVGATTVEYRARRAACLAGLRDPAALSRTCESPLGFEWTVLEATAGTFMDTLVHTWDLAHGHRPTLRTRPRPRRSLHRDVPSRDARTRSSRRTRRARGRGG